MRARRSLVVVALLTAVSTAVGAQAAPPTAARPAPTFTASSAPLPAPLATGSWNEEQPGRRARLAFAATNVHAVTTTSYFATWQSLPFAVPEDLTMVLSAVPSGYYARVTDGSDTYNLAARYRFGSGAWAPWFEIKGAIPKAPTAFIVLGYFQIWMSRPPYVKPGTKLTLELRLSGKLPGDVSVVDSALQVRAGLDAGSPV